MVTAVGVLGIALLVVLQTAIAALIVRFVRVRLDTDWAVVIYVLFLCPVVLTLTTFLFSGVVGLGADLGTRGTAIFVTIGVPIALGVTIDYLWMPAPEEVELPASME